MLETRNKLTVQQRNMQVSMTEIYEIANGVASPIMNSQLWTVNYGTETITCRAPSLWGKLPCEFKHAPSLEEFKVKNFVFCKKQKKNRNLAPPPKKILKRSYLSNI